MDSFAVKDPFADFDDQRTFVKPNPGGRTVPPRPAESAGAGAG